MTSPSHKAYGLRFRGLPRVHELALTRPEDDHIPEVSLRVAPDGRAEPPLHPMDKRRSVRRLADGRLLALDRRLSTAEFFGPRLSPDLLAHPYLAAVATTFNRWSGHETFHAGAFLANGRAWAVAGPRTAGKSTLLAALAARGVPILSDDIVITDGAVAFAGPRCLDLRELLPTTGRIPGEAAPELIRARNDSRWRLMLPGVPDRVPLGGWIFLRWADQQSMQLVAAPELIRRLAVMRGGQGLASDPTTLLALATLPAWELHRARDWSQLDATLDLALTTARDTTARTSTAHPAAIAVL